MTEKCKDTDEFKQSPRSRNYEGLNNLSNEVQKLARPLLGKNGFTQVELLAHWHDILGEELAYGIKPVSLTFPMNQRTNGTLKIRTAGGAFALLFEHQKGHVIERINTYFGYPAVRQIKIEQGGVKLNPTLTHEPEWPLDEEELATLMKKVDGIQDDELRQKMIDIGMALIRKNKKQ